MLIDFYDEYLIIDYIESALQSCQKVVKKGHNKWHFRCNVCGDHTKSKASSAWILKNRNNIWIFNCFNCSQGMGALKWLKVFFPEEYSGYIRTILSKKKPEKKAQFKFAEEKPKPVEKKPKLPFIPIISEKHKDLQIFQDAIKHCEDRKIPKEVWSKFFICLEGKYSNRMIIPFYNNQNGKIYYFSGRLLSGNGSKYIGMEGEKKIYNFYNIDRSKPVIILEGMLDSIFLDNSVALVGLQFAEDFFKKIEGLDAYFMMDCDEPGRKKTLRLLKDGYKVFNWKKFLKDNGLFEVNKYDINQIYILLNRDKNFTFEELKEYFTCNPRDSIYFL